MRRQIKLTQRPQRALVMRRTGRAIARGTPPRREDVFLPQPEPVGAPARTTPLASPPTGPYADYGRWLTAEGGVLIRFKDIDQRLRFTLWRIVAWMAATGFEGWYLASYFALADDWTTVSALLAIAVVNWRIVAKPVEVYRRIEIRPDCLILDGTEVFWTRMMEDGWPAFQPDEKGHLILCGIYGTRFVEYLIAHRFDEPDRMPEVFAAHVEEAIQQLWEQP